MDSTRSRHRLDIIRRALSVSAPSCLASDVAPSVQNHSCNGKENAEEVALCYGNHARPFEEWKVGQRLVTKRRTINDADVVSFIHLTGYDAENLFGDMVYLKEVAGHAKRLVPGMLTGSIADALIVGSGILDGFAIALASLDNFRAVAPVYAGDTIQVEVEVTQVKPSRSKQDRGVVTTHQVVKNQQGKVVLEYDVSRMLRKSNNAKAA